MSKRSCPFDESEQDIKKQINLKSKVRGIRSCSSEKTLQMLYRGAAKPTDQKDEVQGYYNCSGCPTTLSVISKCFYCDKFICPTCANICLNCDEDFCKNCSFPDYTRSCTVCYSCY